MSQPTIVLAGANGDLGGRIAKALVHRGVHVRAIVRRDLGVKDQARLEMLGLTVVAADPNRLDEMATACVGASCVVSALNGLREVIIDRQGILLDAAVKAGVPRFISSDFAADFTKTRPGLNRNFDLRREFMARADLAPIQVTSILNGAFMDMLGREMPIIQSRIHRVLYWGSANQRLDFTTKDNVAAFTAVAALDDSAPRILRIAGDELSAREIASSMSEMTGEQYSTLWVGSLGILSLMIGATKALVSSSNDPFPPWQGMQYMRDQFSGHAKLHPLDNDRYPGMTWTTLKKMLKERVEGSNQIMVD